jgi:hypothetical protein
MIRTWLSATLADNGYFDHNFDIEDFLAGIGYYGRNGANFGPKMGNMGQTYAS